MAQQKGIVDYGKKVAREIADFIFTNSQENLVEMKAIDKSDLFLSGGIEEEKDGVVIRYDAPHANAVNDGTDPHFINPEELEGWVRRKINPGSEKKVKEIAFFVSRSIKKFGTKPRPFFDQAVALAKIKFKLQ